MKRSSIKDKILKVFGNFSSMSIKDIKDDTNLAEYGSFDELDKVEFIMDLESEIGMEIKDVDAEKLNTLKDYIDYIAERMS